MLGQPKIPRQCQGKNQRLATIFATYVLLSTLPFQLCINKYIFNK
jgi:hypothetical protein